METVTDLILGGSEITADGDHSHEMKRRLILGWKAMTHLESILKIKDITFPTEVHLVKAMIFPVVMHGYDSWTIRKAEHRRTDAFELWPPLDCKEIQGVNPKGNQSWILIGRPHVVNEISNTLATWCKELTHWKRPWYWDRYEGRRRREWQRMRWLDHITDLMIMSLSKLQELVWTGKPGMLQSMGSQRVRQDWATKLNWEILS